MPLSSQLYYVSLRMFQQYFRQPEYVLSKYTLGLASGLFVGFSFWRFDKHAERVSRCALQHLLAVHGIRNNGQPNNAQVCHAALL